VARDPHDILRASGLRSTSGRRDVLRMIESSKLPLSHSDVMQRLPPSVANRATVYRILNELARVGLARRVDVGDRVWRFSAATRPSSTTFAMFTCTQCHAARQLLEVELRLPRRAPLALRRGAIQIHLRGACDDCA
jgi:Fe2+ or Zn2+ uptake regulation protein